MRLANKLQYIFLYILSFIIIGVSSILTGQVGLSILKDPAYYINQGLTWAAILCVTFATLYSYIDKFKATNTEYLSNEKYISDFASSKQNVPSIVSRFLEPFNRKRKINQFKFNLHKKLYKLENKKKFIFFGPRIFSDKDLHVWNFGTEEEKNSNPYCIKRNRIEEQLKDSYIEENIDKMFVRYDKVTTNILFGGYYQTKENNSPNDFVTKYQGHKIMKHKVPRLLASFAITFILSSLVFDNFAFNTTSLFNLTVKIMILLWNCYTTLRYAETFSQTVTLKDSRFRKGLILEYEKWLQQEAAKALEQSKEVITDDTRGNSSIDFEQPEV